MPARVVTYLPKLLALLVLICKYGNRYRTEIRNALAGNAAALNAFDVYMDACEALIEPLDAIVNPRP